MPRTRYARSGDVNIAFQVLGNGPLDLVLAAGAFTHLDVLWEEPRYRGFCERLAAKTRLLTFDKRGMGLSDHERAGTIGERMDDIRAVMDAVGSERAAILGASEGGPLAILFATAYPERTSGLILAGAEVKEETTDDWPWGESTRSQFEASMASLADRWGSGSGAAVITPSLANDDAYRAWFGRLAINAAAPTTAVAFMRMAFEIDIRHVLGSVAVPTLVVHRSGDRVCDVHNGRFLAEHIPGARYVELPGVDHFAWVGATDVEEEIHRFIDEVLLPAVTTTPHLPRPEVIGDAFVPAEVPLRLRAEPARARASALFTEGVVAAASGDSAAAVVLLRRAEFLAREDGLILLQARAGLELARNLAGNGDISAADAEARAAMATMHAAGDQDGEARAAELLRSLNLPRTDRSTETGTRLTPREIEILRLIAQGRSNDEIAAELVVSSHTVHRHVANVLTKLGVPSRAAAVAEAARSGLV